MATIEIDELLKTNTREEVEQILVRLTIAADVLDAKFMIAISLGEIKGDVIDLDDQPGKE